MALPLVPGSLRNSGLGQDAFFLHAADSLGV